MKNNPTKGTLEVICGSMFSGKSEELIRRVKRASIAQQSTRTFKHHFDNRSSNDQVNSHDGSSIEAIAVDNSESMMKYINNSVEVVGIDEIQFFPKDIIPAVWDLVQSGKRVIAVGLDLDFRGLPFGIMPTLLALADHVTKLKAVCVKCTKDAHFSQRLVNGKPAKASDPVIVIGAQECYEARCRDCFSIDHGPIFTINK
ncbi:thymidine kinase [bacterium]|nr:thymidine kinase [bacterium]